MDPTTASLILKGGGFLTSLFGRRMSASQRMQLRILQQKYELMRLASTMAKNYNPDAETEIAVDYAQKKTGRQLENAMARLNQRFKVEGGSPTGDTNFVLRQQRTQDDLLNPLSEWMANRKSNAFALKLGALERAGSIGGDLVNGYGQLAQGEYQADQALYGSAAGFFEELMKQQNRGTNSAPTQSQDAIDNLIGRKKARNPYAY